MNRKFLLLAADLLDLAADEFGNHGCNDYAMPKDLTLGDFQDLADLLDRSNMGRNDLSLLEWREANPDDMTTPDLIRERVTDFAAMTAMAFMLRLLAETIGEGAPAGDIWVRGYEQEPEGSKATNVIIGIADYSMTVDNKDILRVRR